MYGKSKKYEGNMKGYEKDMKKITSRLLLRLRCGIANFLNSSNHYVPQIERRNPKNSFGLF